MSDNKDNSINSIPESIRSQEFFKLFMVNHSRIYTYILMMLPHASDADDVLQETAVTMWTKFDEYRTGSDFASWAVTISYYKILQFRRKHFNDHIQYSSRTLERISETAAQKVEQESVVQQYLKKCLSKLPDSDRKLIILRYNQDITTKALSQRIGRSVNGLYKALSRIHNVLLECMLRTKATEERG